jgi:hypothetical protein
MNEPDGLVLLFKPSDGDQSLLIEDNGRVAYAYLIDSTGNICAQVWLYNRCPAPDEPEWTAPDMLPFANARFYVRTDIDIPLPTSASDFSVVWQGASDGAYQADIRIGDHMLARLTPNVTPGWCVLAAQDGPLAKMLVADASPLA